MQDHSLCKCKSFDRRTAKEWPKVLVVSLHQFLNGGRQDLLCAGDSAIHDPVKTAEHKIHKYTHIKHSIFHKAVQKSRKAMLLTPSQGML